MSVAHIANVRIAGVASAVPDRIVTIDDDARRFGDEEMRRIAKNTGVKQRHIAHHLCASDLAQHAAERLLKDLGWERDSIDVLVFVTQCPDYLAPATACLLQARMGLRTSCAAFDVNLGCSGYVYGLWLAASLVSGGTMKRGLLLVGDTASRAASPQDRSVVPLFGDASSATALEFFPGAPAIDVVLGTDGRGARHLHMRAGGHRHHASPASFVPRVHEDGITRTDTQTYMNGAEVLTFTIEAVPKLISEMRSLRGWTEDEIDGYVFHQASAFVLKTLARASRIPTAKLSSSLENYGNTSVATIPVTLTDQLAPVLSQRSSRLVLAGFGIGWSWAAAAVECGPMVMPPMLVVPDVPVEAEF